MGLFEIACCPVEASGDVQISVSGARDRIAMVVRGVLRVFDAGLRQLTSWNLGDCGLDARLLATESGIVLAAEDGLRSWSWEGEAGTSIAFTPWGGGLMGDITLLHGVLWSIHFAEGPEAPDGAWVLSRFEPKDLRLLEEVSLTGGGDFDPLQLAMYPLMQDEVGIMLYDAPEYLGSLVARATPDGLHVQEAPPKPDDMFDPIPLGPSRWLVEAEEGTTLVDAKTMEPLAWATDEKLFGVGDAGGASDAISTGFARSDGTFFVHTYNGQLGRLRRDGHALHLEHLKLPGTSVKQSSMSIDNVDTSFRGTVTREVTDIRRVEPLDEARLLTLHALAGGEFALRIYGVED